MNFRKPCNPLACGLALAALFPLSLDLRADSVARTWNEQNLAAIRVDFPHPPVHARNLFHTSVAMWDAWAAYDPVAVGYVHRESASSADVAAARHEAISYAAYGVLKTRYALSVNAVTTLNALRTQMTMLGYDPDNANTAGGAPDAVGNRVAEAVLAFAFDDGANEGGSYEDPNGYTPANDPLILQFAGTELLQPNRWQPLAFEVRITQNGLEADEIQSFLGPHWGAVRPFGIARSEGADVYFDPGLPPQLGGFGDTAYKHGNLTVVRFSRVLDPENGEMIDISPASRGNNTLGRNDGIGHASNPATGQAYDPNVVPHGDFGRVVAEFWADGPDSETPPGHWNTLANEVAEHPEFTRQFEGVGPVLDELEWDVKVYLAINAAVHDVAVAAWGCKEVYDYVRPISSIRHMGGLGQSSDNTLPSYHPDGIPLEPGLVELVTANSAMAGQRHEGLPVGSIAIFAWGGEPDDPKTEFTGAKWIRAIDWLPYQRDTFVTPAFAGYVSGHSAFSRAAAEVLTAMTGSAYFPGGMGTFLAKQNEFLEFEQGPSVDVELQWATYYDAADEAGISRLYGGIHVPVDDGPGRTMGSSCGIAAWELVRKYYDGSILEEDFRVSIDADGILTWNAIRGMFYTVEESTDLRTFTPVGSSVQAGDVEMSMDVSPLTGDKLYRVVRSSEALN